MKIINKIIPSLIVASSLINADIAIDSVGANFGWANIYADQTNRTGSVALSNEPDEKYIQGEIYVLIGGVFDDKSWKPSINYIQSRNNEFTNQIFMAGINKYFFKENYNLYAGLFIGMGRLDWKYNPISSTSVDDRNVQSIVGALQAGVEYPITNSFSLGVNAKYYLHDYETVLAPSSSVSVEINQKYSSSITIGLRYLFGEE